MWFGFVWKRSCFAALGGFSPSVQLLWGRCERQLWGVTSVLCSEAAASIGSAEFVKGPRLLPKNRGHFTPKSPNTGLFIHHSVIMWYFFSPKTPSSWTEETRGRRSAGGHKRSASWGSAEHLREASGHLSLNQISGFPPDTRTLRSAPFLWCCTTQSEYTGGAASERFQNESSCLLNPPFAPPSVPQVAKLRNQLQKRSRHVPPPAGHEPPHHPLSAGHAAGITQVARVLFSF